MKKSSLLFTILLVGLASAQQRQAVRPQQSPKTSEAPVSSGVFYGSIFSDYLYVFQEPQTANIAAGKSGRNEFVIRRAALGYLYRFTKEVSANVQYDVAGGGLYQAYADVRNIIPLMDVRLGMMQNSSAETMEKFWDYRSLDAFVLERNGLLAEFDRGVTVTGRANPQGTIYGRLGVFNGTGLTGETDKLKKFTLTAGNWFDRTSAAELYVDYENVGFGRSTVTAKVFYGMKLQKYALGVEAFYRMNRKFAGTKDVTPLGGSLFGWFEMVKSLRGIVRVDVLDVDLNNSNVGYREVYVNAGLDYSPVADVRLIPNVGYTKQMKKGNTTVNADVMTVRLTASVAFPSAK